VLDDALAHLERKVQPGMRDVTPLKAFHDSQRVQVVVEAQSVLLHKGIQRLFAGMSEWRMADVVNQGKRLDQVLIEMQRSGDRPRNLCNFDGMRQPVAEVIGEPLRENLCFVFKPPKRPRVNDAVTVALEIITVRMWFFREPTPSRLFNVNGVRRKR
jgi:hypothetical protein